MENKQLEKSLGAAAALSTVVGMVIGGGVFFKPQAVYTLTGGAPGLGMLVWVLAGIVTIAAGLTAAEVSAAIPKTGGMMVYIEEIYGKKLGFLTGWMQSVLFFPATIAAISVMFGQQAAILLGNESLVIPMTVGVILLIGVLNTFGSKTSGAIQTVSTVCKLIPLVLIIVFGFIKGGGDNPIVQPLVAEGISPTGVIGQLLVDNMGYGVAWWVVFAFIIVCYGSLIVASIGMTRLNKERIANLTNNSTNNSTKKAI